MKRQYLNAMLVVALVLASISFLTSCKDYTNDIGSLQDQIDRAALATDVQTLRAQVKTAIDNDSATAVVAKKAVDAAAANAGNIANLNDDLSKLEGNISANSKATAKRIDSLATAGTVTDSEILKLYAANKAAADSAASALAKNRELSADLAKAVKEWSDAKADYYTAEEIDAILYIIAAYFEDIDTRINETNTNLEELRMRIINYKVVVDALYTAVTEVTLVTGNGTAFVSDLKFDYGTITQDLTFGESEKDDAVTPNIYSATPTKTYKEGVQLIFPKEILVRVNPVNANITPGMIKLVNSKGEVLDSLIEITKVEKYDEYLYKEGEGTRTRASIATGLWKVTLQPKANIDVENQIAQTTKVNNTDKSILFAVAINNTASQAAETQNAADRYVVSDYELTVGKADKAFEAAKYPSTATDETTTTGITVKGTDLINCKGYTESTGSEQYIQAKNGEEIEVSFEGDSVKDKIDRFYVVLDKKFSSLNEWTAYTFEGLDNVVAVNKGVGKAYVKVTIPETSTKKELNVPLRIFAVNYNGVYYNEHGNPFTLHVVKDQKQASVAADMNFTGYEQMETSWIPVTATLQDATAPLTTPIVNLNTIVVTDTVGHEITLNVEYATDEKGTQADKDSEVKYVKFSISGSSISEWVDGGKAKGTISNSLNTLQVSLVKNMPTKEVYDNLKIEKYSWKENQLVDGVYTAYMYPYYQRIDRKTNLSPSWNLDASTAYKKMNEAISELDNKYSIVVDNVRYSARGEYKDPAYINYTTDAFSWLLYLDNVKLVDTKTQHRSEIRYNFGKISSESNGSYFVPVETYQTVLACALDESVQKYSWTKLKTSTGEEDVNFITYGDTSAPNSDPTKSVSDALGGYALQHVTSDVVKPESGQIMSVLNYIKATNSSGLSDFDKTLNALMTGTYKKYQYLGSSIKLISNKTQKEDYFKAYINWIEDEKKIYIYFKPILTDDAYNPSEDVPSTLVINLVDPFGHTHTINMPFVVKRRQ